MNPTLYPPMNALLDLLRENLQTVLGARLVGLYLYGSLVAGDFDAVSDIDLLAATSGELDAAAFDALDRMQRDFVAQHPQWHDRIEIVYLSLQALRTFRTQTSRVAVISPGEPFHFKEAGREWLMNWYIVREQGVTLLGPPPETLIDPISTDEFIQVVKEHVESWDKWVLDLRDTPGQAYAILTLCRALYACQHGQQASKRRAALWTAEALPEWSETIQNALRWRQESRTGIPTNPEATVAETQRFVQAVRARILTQP
ncbi:MAG: DUF4111 domain-containing protein [Anaerolineae bacterium]|nr:DUF4111 domain-containing protein [Anaerolineae bacterium]